VLNLKNKHIGIVHIVEIQAIIEFQQKRFGKIKSYSIYEKVEVNSRAFLVNCLYKLDLR